MTCSLRRASPLRLRPLGWSRALGSVRIKILGPASELQAKMENVKSEEDEVTVLPEYLVALDASLFLTSIYGTSS